MGVGEGGEARINFKSHSSNQQIQSSLAISLAKFLYDRFMIEMHIVSIQVILFVQLQLQHYKYISKSMFGSTSSKNTLNSNIFAATSKNTSNGILLDDIKSKNTSNSNIFANTLFNNTSKSSPFLVTKQKQCLFSPNIFNKPSEVFSPQINLFNIEDQRKSLKTIPERYQTSNHIEQSEEMEMAQTTQQSESDFQGQVDSRFDIKAGRQCNSCLKPQTYQQFDCIKCVQHKIKSATDKYSTLLQLEKKKTQEASIQIQTLEQQNTTLQADLLAARSMLQQNQQQLLKFKQREQLFDITQMFLLGHNRRQNWNELRHFPAAIKQFIQLIEKKIPILSKTIRGLLAAEEYQLLQKVKQHFASLPSKIKQEMAAIESKMRKQLQHLVQTQRKLSDFMNKEKQELAKQSFDLSNQTAAATLKPISKDRQFAERQLKRIAQLKSKADNLFQLNEPISQIVYHQFGSDPIVANVGDSRTS